MSICDVQMYVTLKGTDGSGASWDVSEAALYIMTAVAKDLSPWVAFWTCVTSVFWCR